MNYPWPTTASSPAYGPLHNPHQLPMLLHRHSTYPYLYQHLPTQQPHPEYPTTGSPMMVYPSSTQPPTTHYGTHLPTYPPANSPRAVVQPHHTWPTAPSNHPPPATAQPLPRYPTPFFDAPSSKFNHHRSCHITTRWARLPHISHHRHGKSTCPHSHQPMFRCQHTIRLQPTIP